MATCKEPALNARIAELCFAQTDDEDRSVLEAHLLVCDECWTEFQRISEAVYVLRSEKSLVEPIMAADLIQLVGLGAGIQRRLGGHAGIAAMVAFGYGAMMALALLVEVAYRWERYAGWAVLVSIGIGVTSAVAWLLAFEITRKKILAGRSNAAGYVLVPILAWTALVGLIIAPFLPTDPVVQAEFQTMTGQIGWIKSIAQALQIPLLSLIPLQFVLSMQHELWSNRIDRVLRVLTKDPMGIVPKGALFIRPAIAAVIFVLIATWWIAGNAHLLENLEPSPYLTLFMALAISRMMVVLITLLGVLIWYARMLNELKREAIAVSAGRKPLDTH